MLHDYFIDLKTFLRETGNSHRIWSVKGGRLAAHDLIGHMYEWKQDKWSSCITNVTKDAGKVSSFKIKVITMRLNMGGTGDNGLTLHKHRA